MDEHIEIGHKYPSVKLNTTYSFGLDDQEFVVAFETDRPEDFLDLVMHLRQAEGSRYTKRGRADFHLRDEEPQRNPRYPRRVIRTIPLHAVFIRSVLRPVLFVSQTFAAGSCPDLVLSLSLNEPWVDDVK